MAREEVSVEKKFKNWKNQLEDFLFGDETKEDIVIKKIEKKEKEGAKNEIHKRGY